ncbi:MAG: C40 family peptidase [Paracoccaceae bacterium]
MKFDRRITPFNGRVAAERLRGRVEAAQFTKGAARLLSVPVADLLRAPHGPRERQLLMGESVTVYESRDGWAYVEAARDGFCGYLRDEQLEERLPPTHWVRAPASHLYSEADFKRPERAGLSFGARLRVTASAGRFAETEDGFVPAAHIAPLDEVMGDPVAVAALFLGTPYLWGGNTRAGIDCSGLVQGALLACGHACPGDSDLQERALGDALPDGAELRRGDLMFWRGHVAWVVGEGQILHANAHHMAVAFEGLEAALARIAAQGDGAVTSVRRGAWVD